MLRKVNKKLSVEQLLDEMETLIVQSPMEVDNLQNTRITDLDIIESYHSDNEDL